ncbi:MAG: zinc ribbon domain-containing protein [bacterium]|nr:zinc ribbon domain-containing protein [bacterium]
MTRECASCSSPLAKGARFCAQCGHPVALACGNCDAELSPGDKFCATCGTPSDAPSNATGAAAVQQAAPPALPSDEATSSEARKVISVFFADLNARHGIER